MKKIIKYILLFIASISIIYVAYIFYDKYENHYFEVVTEGKVYHSSFIPPDEIVAFLRKKKIKTVIDLREGMKQDELNPETKGEINEERKMLKNYPEFNYYNVPTLQIPADSTIIDFIKIMENPSNYPVLIHCYHGTGRAVLFSNIYRIEFENWSPKKAQQNAKPLVEFSSFAADEPKGIYLLQYKKRRK